jgi:histidine triad (HIT) family protein
LLLGRVMAAAGRLAREGGLADYRIVSNNGAGAGQSVFHLHVHLLSGRPFAWPPG